jgi:Uma2 family endonuclease
MVANAKLMPPRRPFTVDEYHRMVKAGILREDDRVELIEGEIVEMAPVGDPHVGCVIELTGAFTKQLADRAKVSVQSPVRLSPRSEPEPDLAVLRLGPEPYRRAPRAEDVLLVIEVSDMTLAYDRGIKLRLYAAAGIPEVWIWNLKRRRVLIFRDPIDGAYRETMIASGGEISPLAFPDVVVNIERILG